MTKLFLLGMAVALFGCGGSKANAPDAKGGADAAADAAKTEVPGIPVDAADIAPDRGKADTPDAAFDRAPDEGTADPSVDGTRGETGSSADAKPDRSIDVHADGLRLADGGESCACGTKLSWACFCSVENCGRTLADFVESGDGGRVARTGQAIVIVLDYADCNLVVVRAKTYSDYSPASEYVFDRTTGALVGAVVQLDDRQHLCPWEGDARWVFNYSSGTTVPSSCKATECLPGRESCSGSMDAR